MCRMCQIEVIENDLYGFEVSHWEPKEPIHDIGGVVIGQVYCEYCGRGDTKPDDRK